MGHRAIIGTTLPPDGKIKSYYSHWGALNAHDCKEEDKPLPPEPDNPNDFKIFQNTFEFGKSIDYLEIEAVWLDKRCYLPISTLRKGGKGMLIKCDTGFIFNYYDDILTDLSCFVDKLVFLPDAEKEELTVNYILGKLPYDNNLVPDFSPSGYKVKYKDTKNLLLQLQEKVKL